LKLNSLLFFSPKK